MPDTPLHTVSWIVLEADINVASFRYRCLAPAFSQSLSGWKVNILSGAAPKDAAADILVFVKAFGPHHVALARRAKQAGSKIIIDICDNIFVTGYSHIDDAVTTAGFFALAELADVIVTPSRSLAAIVAEHVKDATKVTMIPDSALSREDLLQIERWLGEEHLHKDENGGSSGLTKANLCDLKRFRDKLTRIRPFISRKLQVLTAYVHSVPRRLANVKTRFSGRALTVPRKRVVWFGKHGTRHSSTGIIALSTIIPDLVAVNHRVPLELVVISNNKAKYLRYLTGLPFPTHYRRWSNEITSEELSRADLVVLPNLSNSFVTAKSANRALLALSHGVPVIASRLDSLSELNGAIAVENWTQNLLTYLTDEATARHDVEYAQQIIADLFSLSAVGDMWSHCLLSALREGEPGVGSVSLMDEVDRL